MHSTEFTQQAISANQTATGYAPEGIFTVLLICIATYLGVSSFYLEANVVPFVQQVSVTVLFVLVVAVHRLIRHYRWSSAYRCLLFLGLISYLYDALAGLAFNHVPWLSDHTLYSFDAVLGLELIHLQIAVELTQVRWITELLSIGYIAFIPYLTVSVFLNGTQSDTQLRELFLLSVALMYAIGFLGYLFVPAHGPVVLLSEQYSFPINSGLFHALVTHSVDQAGGPHGAFPSIHVCGSVLMCLFDFRHGSRTRGWLYLPLILLIGVATVVLRYHYFVDLLAGVALAFIALFVAELWVFKGYKNIVNKNP